MKSLGVMILSIILYFFPKLTYIDAIYTIIVSILIITMTIELMDDCIHELIGGVPEDFDLKKFKKALYHIKGVIELHDVHVWNLSENIASMTCHLIVENHVSNDKIL